MNKIIEFFIAPHRDRTKKWWCRYILNWFLSAITFGYLLTVNHIYDRDNNLNGERWLD